MKLDILLFLLLLLFASIGLFFSAINRKRRINEEQFIQKIQSKLRIKKDDLFNIDRYKHHYFLYTIVTSIILSISLVTTIYILGGSIRDVTESQMSVVEIIASFTASVFLLRLNLMYYFAKQYVTRINNDKYTYFEFGYIILNGAFIIVFFYNLITYIL